MNELGRRRVPFLLIADFAMQRPLVLPLAEISPREILFNINGKSNATEQCAAASDIFFEKFPLSLSAYRQKFDLVKRHIQAGDSFLVNLTAPTPIATNLSLREIFHRSQARYKLWFRDEFVVFSPEIFVQISNGQIASFPMKGTIDANLPRAKQQILNDKKETAEHNTIVDLIRNDLSMVATDVQVERFRYVEKVRTNGKHLLQVSSKIIGNLEPDYHAQLGDILFAMLPAGSISGAPKPKTLEIIRAAEQYERGYYTGIFGIFDGKNLDSGVMIRFIERAPHGLVYKSGGGITHFSELEKEYQELIDKVYVPITGNHPHRKPTDLQSELSQ